MTRNQNKEVRSETGSRIHGTQSSEASEPLSMRIITHNIRYATKSPFKGKEPWPIRCPLLCSELVFNSEEQETFIFPQEVLHSQLVKILRSLNKSISTYRQDPWSYIGVGRDNGKATSEFPPILSSIYLASKAMGNEVAK